MKLYMKDVIEAMERGDVDAIGSGLQAGSQHYIDVITRSFQPISKSEIPFVIVACKTIAEQMARVSPGSEETADNILSHMGVFSRVVSVEACTEDIMELIKQILSGKG